SSDGPLGGPAERARGDRAPQELRPPRRAVGALPHGGAHPPARARRGLRTPRPRVERGRAARVRAAPRLRRRLRDPNVPPARLRPGDALRAARAGLATRAAGAARGGRPRRRPRAARAPAAPCRRPFLLPERLPARGAARERVADRPASPAPRDP